MIVKVIERRINNERSYVVEYDTGKTRRYNTINAAIAKFCSDKKPRLYICTNGKEKYYEWECK